MVEDYSSYSKEKQLFRKKYRRVIFVSNKYCMNKDFYTFLDFYLDRSPPRIGVKRRQALTFYVVNERLYVCMNVLVASRSPIEIMS